MASFFEDPLKIIIVFAIGLAILYQLYKFVRHATRVEPYEDAPTLEGELKKELSQCEKILCAPLAEIRTSLEQAKKTIEEDAGTAIYDCETSKKDLLMIPAEIDKILLNTIVYVEKRVAETLQKNKDALTCKNKEEGFAEYIGIEDVILEHADVEGFEPNQIQKVCTGEVAETKRKELQKQTQCVLPEQISESQKAILLEDRLTKIQNLFKDQTIQTSVANIQTQYDELTALKAKMEDGSIRPQCGEL
jgi:hypothetical protein